MPVLLVAYVLHERARQRGAAAWSTPALLPNLVERAPGARRHLPVALLLVALAVMIVGVARPHAKLNVRREEATVLLAMDVSRSMAATDVPPTRLRAAQTAATRVRLQGAEEVPHRRRLVLDARAGDDPADRGPHARSATRSNRCTRAKARRSATPSRSPRVSASGSASTVSSLPRRCCSSPTARATAAAARREAAARQAKALHVPVYTILLGTPNGIVHHKLPGGYTETLRVPPSAQTLQMIARVSGGQFFTASNDKRLGEVYDQLRSRLGHKKETRELTDGFAAGSALLLLVAGGLSAFWFRRVP